MSLGFTVLLFPCFRRAWKILESMPGTQSSHPLHEMVLQGLIEAFGSPKHPHRLRKCHLCSDLSSEVAKNLLTPPGDGEISPSLSDFKRHLEKALNNVLKLLVSPELERHHWRSLPTEII